MMRLYLTRGNTPVQIPKQLPITPGEAGCAFAQLDSISTRHPTYIQNIQCEVPGLLQYIQNVDIDSSEGFTKLNELAKKISEMTRKECITFSGALDARSINGIDDVLRTVDKLDDYTLIPKICSDSELGLYVVDSGMLEMPEQAKPYLDYTGIGRKFYSDLGGAYTDEGYVVRKDALDPSHKNRFVAVSLTASANGKLSRIYLPAELEELREIMDKLEIVTFDHAEISNMEIHTPYLEGLLPIEPDGICVDEANELAQAIEEFNQWDGALMKYLAVLSVVQPTTMREALGLTMELHDYERVTEDAALYGQEVLRRHGADDEILQQLRGYMDFEQYGRDSMVEDGVRQTEFGLIRRCSEPFPEEQQDMQFGGM